MELGLLLIRVVLGLTLAAHGAQKLFGAFGGQGRAGTGAYFDHLGLHPGPVMATMAGLGEFGGGLALAAGLVTPWAAAVVIAVMLVAIITVHHAKGFFNSNGGMEFPLLIAAVAAGLAFIGPGSLSLDAALGVRLAGPVWGVVAIVAGMVGATLPLTGWVSRKSGRRESSLSDAGAAPTRSR